MGVFLSSAPAPNGVCYLVVRKLILERNVAILNKCIIYLISYGGISFGILSEQTWIEIAYSGTKAFGITYLFRLIKLLNITI